MRPPDRPAVVVPPQPNPADRRGRVSWCCCWSGSRLIDIYVDWLWFGEVGFRGVFTTVLVTRIVLFLRRSRCCVGGLVGLTLCHRLPDAAGVRPGRGPDDPSRGTARPCCSRPKLFGIGIPVFVGVIAGLAAQADWQTVQLFLNGTAFGVNDPEFGLDVGFYAFHLPFYRWCSTGCSSRWRSAFFAR